VSEIIIVDNSEREALLAAKKALLDEYVADGKPADQLNWNYRKAVEARVELARMKEAASAGIPGLTIVVARRVIAAVQAANLKSLREGEGAGLSNEQMADIVLQRLRVLIGGAA
jgi:hypothetical protein